MATLQKEDGLAMCKDLIKDGLSRKEIVEAMTDAGAAPASAYRWHLQAYIEVSDQAHRENNSKPKTCIISSALGSLNDALKPAELQASSGDPEALKLQILAAEKLGKTAATLKVSHFYGLEQ